MLLPLAVCPEVEVEVEVESINSLLPRERKQQSTNEFDLFCDSGLHSDLASDQYQHKPVHCSGLLVLSSFLAAAARSSLVLLL